MRLSPLSPSELQELEAVLEFTNGRSPSTDDESGWRNDWSGNLAYIDKEIHNPLFRVKNLRNRQSRSGGSGGSRGRKPNEKMTILQWAALIEDNGATVAKANAVRRMLKCFLRHVCTYAYYEQRATVDKKNHVSTAGSPRPVHQQNHKVPSTVVKLFSSLEVESLPLSAIEDAIRRASYDPQILKEDGWTTEKSDESHGATGGPFRIGDKIRYENADAVVIAYIHDNDIGDLWKALWTEDYICFDLEAEELLQARRKWERIHKKNEQDSTTTTTTTSSVVRRRAPGREAAIGANGSVDFTVKGIEYGIVLAASYAKGARPGVYWPARVMHASEAPGSIKRNSSKSQKKLELVFLAPYWNSADDLSYGAAKLRAGPSLSENEESFFSNNPILQFETVDAIDEMVKEYPFGDDEENGEAFLDVAKLQMSFRFTGLPKSAFPRFLDAYRLAGSLREYAKSHLEIIRPSTESPVSHRATAALFEAHPLAVQVPLFPTVILHLPFTYILAEVLKARKTSDGGSGGDKEPLIQLGYIVEAMSPPSCWGRHSTGRGAAQVVANGGKNKTTKSHSVSTKATSGDWLQAIEQGHEPEHDDVLRQFVTDFPSLNEIFDSFSSSPSLAGALTIIYRMLKLPSKNQSVDDHGEVHERCCNQLKSTISSWAAMKRVVEDALLDLVALEGNPSIVSDWRFASEKIYRYLVGSVTKATILECKKDGVSTLVITDSLCNEHRTSDHCLERRVRLPAALKVSEPTGKMKRR